MYIWYLLYCLCSLETTDCAYEDIPQDSHWYSPAVSEGYLFVRAGMQKRSITAREYRIEMSWA